MQIISSSIEVMTKPYLHSGYISGNGMMMEPEQKNSINFITVIVTAFVVITGSVISAVIYKFLKKVNRTLYVTLSAVVILILAIATFLITDYILNSLVAPVPVDSIFKEKSTKIYDRDGEEIYKIDATKTGK